MSVATAIYERRGGAFALETVAAWLLGILWVLPLVFAFWTAFHPAEFSTRFLLGAPLTLENFEKHLREFGSRPEVREALDGYMDLVVEGRREVYRVV